MSTPNPSYRKMEWLEAMRGFAAIWVLLHHAKQSVDHFVGDMGARPMLTNGYLGVDFFFVLSGFIIAFASHRLADRGGGIREYARARVMRIYIPYLPVGVAIFLLYLVLPSLSEGGRSPGALTSFTLVPSNSPPALSVAWTLVHEMIFYAIYALRFVHRALFRGVFALWVASILGVAAMDIEMPLAARYFLSPLNLCFVLGVLVFHVNARVRGGGGSVRQRLGPCRPADGGFAGDAARAQPHRGGSGLWRTGLGGRFAVVLGCGGVATAGGPGCGFVCDLPGPQPGAVDPGAPAAGWNLHRRRVRGHRRGCAAGRTAVLAAL